MLEAVHPILTQSEPCDDTIDICPTIIEDNSGRGETIIIIAPQAFEGNYYGWVWNPLM